MDVGVVMWPIEDWPAMGRRWQEAERMGFHTAWVYDHVAWGGYTPWDDGYATLAAAAAVTGSIRLGTLVTSPNFRHPVPTATAVRTIDRISGGRLTLGIGSGGTAHTSDGDILGREWSAKERAARFEEFVGQLDTLLTTSPATLEGEHWSAREVTIAPGLVQRRPPFYLAAEGPRGMRLAARYGQGWIVGAHNQDGPSLPGLKEKLARLTEACDAVGRDPGTLRRVVLTGFSWDPWLDSVAAFEELRAEYADAGFTDVALHWPRPGTAWDADMAVFERIGALAAG